MVLENNPNKVLKFGKISDLSGGLGYLPCGSADCTTRVLLVDYLPSNSNNDPMNLSITNLNELACKLNDLDINKELNDLDSLMDDDFMIYH